MCLVGRLMLTNFCHAALLLPPVNASRNQSAGGPTGYDACRCSGLHHVRPVLRRSSGAIEAGKRGDIN